MRISSFLVDRHFASSLAVRGLLYLLVELNHPNALAHSGLKLLIIQRMTRIVKYSRLMCLGMTGLNTDSSIWIKNHFQEIEFFIRERQRWAIAPIATTQEALEADFYKLAPIFISNMFGEFTWLSQKLSVRSPQIDTRTSFREKFLKLLFSILPLGVFAFLLFNRKLLNGWDIEPKIVALLFISWFMILIDYNFKLGFVESVVKIAQGIKDISK